MPSNSVFRVYRDEEVMLKVYNRRLDIADALWNKGKADKERFIARYDNEKSEDQYTSRGHRITATDGISNIDTMYSGMVAVDVEYICRAIGNGTPLQSLVAERALNQMWRDTHGQSRIKPAVKDACLVDIGWVKVYYDYVEDTELRDLPEEALMSQVLEMRFSEPNLTDDEMANRLVTQENVQVVLRDRVCVEYVPWDDIRVDPTARKIDDVRWVAQYTRLPVPEVTHHPVWRAFVLDRYGEQRGKTMLDDVRGDSSVLSSLKGSYDDIEGIGSDEESDDKRVTVVEMWDFETGLVTVFPEGQSDLVLYQYTNPLMMNLDMRDRNPFKPLIVRGTASKLEGNGDMRVIYPSLKELDEYRSNVATYVARSIPKTVGPANALTEAGKKALQSREWGEYVGLEEGVTRNEIGNLEPPVLPQEVYHVIEGVQAGIAEATGASEPARGVFPERRTTATETSIVTNRGDQRQAERRSNLEEFYVSIARTALQLMQLFYDHDRMMRYTDDLGEEWVWKWNRSDIALDADIDIALTPKENLTRGERVQRALQFMNLALPLPETDRAALLKFVAREMGLRDDEIRPIVKSPQEVEAENQQAQVAAQLSAAPQSFPNAPPGLSIRASGG